ncbi:MAG: MoaD/ThiS family protein [Planctomycetota bacterium]|nr:MAG: MoaD/ThiS family protein [Planctomycetota bacterium]
MHLRVLLFAGLRDLAGGRGAVEVELGDSPTVGAVRQAIAAAVPALAQVEYQVAVDTAFSGDQETVAEGQEVALIPPVSGG